MSATETFILRDLVVVKKLIKYLESNYHDALIENKPMVVRITKYKSVRTVEQNKYYWSVLQQIAESGWVNARQYSSEIWHEFLKKKFIGLDDLPDGGAIGKTTTTLNTKEMADYITQVEAFAATELNITLEDKIHAEH